MSPRRLGSKLLVIVIEEPHDLPADQIDRLTNLIEFGDRLDLKVASVSRGLMIDSALNRDPIWVRTALNRYDPTFGDSKTCVCGHLYYRHFDTYENMLPIGCKYCGCDRFDPGVISTPE